VDYAFDSREKALVDAVDALSAGHPVDGLDWVGGADDGLAALVEHGDSCLDRLLVVDQSSFDGLPALPGGRLLVAFDVLGSVPDRPVAVAPAGRRGPVRIPPSGGLLLTFDGPKAWMSKPGPSEVTPVESSFGYPYGEVEAAEAEPLSDGAGLTLRSRWALSIAAEIAGTARAGLMHTARHLDEREQFGRPLSSFQALRHRLAELAVSVEAATWLAREAAWRNDLLSATTALGYARDLAATMCPELIQLCGARGFTIEFPVHRFAMRLEGLRLEAGAADRLAAAGWSALDESPDTDGRG
jgi:Acyl-CoA dehydrogenase, C-terminal domain